MNADWLRDLLPRPPAHCTLLLRALADPLALRRLGPADLDLLVRVARRARLHGILHARLVERDATGAVPDRVLAQLESGGTVARYRLQLALLERHHLARVLAPLGVPLVLLKGGAYAAQDLPFAVGRPLNDLDLMVPAARLDQVETTLRRAGWRSEVDDPYDERYYREWSHEIPPLIGPDRALEVDLHHTILPPTGRLRPDAARLFNDAVPLPGSVFRVLAPVDQVLHAAVHLMQDIDASERLRDLVDIDGLLRCFGARPRFAVDLLSHAAHHGLQRPLWYAVHFAREWLDTPLDAGLVRCLEDWAPREPARTCMDALITATVFPMHPDRGRTPTRHVAWQLLRMRAMWMRMPAGLLLRHAASKLGRKFRAQRHATPAAG